MKTISKILIGIGLLMIVGSSVFARYALITFFTGLKNSEAKGIADADWGVEAAVDSSVVSLVGCLIFFVGISVAALARDRRPYGAKRAGFLKRITPGLIGAIAGASVWYILRPSYPPGHPDYDIYTENGPVQTIYYGLLGEDAFYVTAFIYLVVAIMSGVLIGWYIALLLRRRRKPEPVPDSL
jgi:hypothetical protein